MTRRVRIYSRQPGMSDEQAPSLRLAADREFLATERLDHPNVVRAHDRLDTDLGTALVFDHDPKALRLDHWLADHADLGSTTAWRCSANWRRRCRRSTGARSPIGRCRPAACWSGPVGRRTASPAGWCWSPTSRWPAGTTATRPRPSAAPDAAGTARHPARAALPRRLATWSCWPTSAALRYQAPEVSTEDDPDGVSLDVFSFGALAFQVLSG